MTRSQTGELFLGFPPISRSNTLTLVLRQPAGYRSDRLPLQVSFFSSIESFECSPRKSNEPPEKSENCPLHSLTPGGRAVAVAFGGYTSYFSFPPLIVFVRERFVCLRLCCRGHEDGEIFQHCDIIKGKCRASRLRLDRMTSIS